MVAEDKPWFKFWPADVPKSIKYPAIPLHGLLQATAEKYPKKFALTYGDTKFVYSQLDMFSNQFAHALEKFKITKGRSSCAFFTQHPPVCNRVFWGS